MFVIKKIGEPSFVRQTCIIFPSYVKTKYEWVSLEDDAMNLTIFRDWADAQEISENMNQDEEGNKIEMCEVKCLALFDPFSV